jgi:hypothetical protein
MRRRLHQRTGSLLALFAMLLITFAPAVSQLLAAHASSGVLTAELCSAHASATSTSSQAPEDHHDSLAHLDGAACGYCHFFAHAPALPGAGIASALVLPAQRAVVIASIDDARRNAPFTHAQSRAPPVLI